jgi:hypothetical protein
MRARVVGFAFVALVAFASGTLAKPAGPYSSTEGGYSVRFPDSPKVNSQTAKTAVGEITVTTATYANSDGNTYLVSYADFPSAATKPENLTTLFDGVREGVKGKGKQVGTDKDQEFGTDKLPMREFVIDKEKQRIKLRAIVRDNRLYQIAVIGTADFAGGKDAKLFFESFELTK